MAMCNVKFIYANILRAAELRLGPDVMFSDDVRKTIDAWCPVLRMDSLSSSIALLNIVATTLEFSSVLRSAGDRVHVPLNLYSMVLARSCMYLFILSVLLNVRFLFFQAYGKSDISNLIRSVLGSIRCAHGDDVDVDLCLDEFSRAGLMNSLDKCTKIFMTDEADITFADTGLFNGFSKPSAEMNCRCRFIHWYWNVFLHFFSSNHDSIRSNVLAICSPLG